MPEYRSAGVLLHPTSLPGPCMHGELGPNARRFVDFLHDCGLAVWQVLPLNPPHEDGSPYQAQSVHAGDHRLISLEWIAERGWLDAEDISVAASSEARSRLLLLSRRAFETSASPEIRHEFDAFIAHHQQWLPDYALFRALRRHHDNAPWWEWPQTVRDREPDALKAASAELLEHTSQCIFEQFLFFKQWGELRGYANHRGIRLFGDMPIFVALDSADVWCNRAFFDLDETGAPRHVAGVPPDYFSATGQLWGNPLYDWPRMEADGFAWWKTRLESQLELFDFLRVDHFRGFEACWSVAAHEHTAQNGCWQATPGRALFDALVDTFGSLPLVAEDLGVITPEVERLRDDYGFPGMKILQFAFDGGPSNPYLPHNHRLESVVYTGTHDNDTTLGWFDASPPELQNRVIDYFGTSADPMPWPLVRAAFASVAQLAIVPLQDLLGLGSADRMNTPGTTEGNWHWRFKWEQIEEGLSGKVSHLCAMYGRYR
ncbi:4-alpha-glucanotransferase [Acidihalobacter ferrooxydans]|uniref:4-alpha-glucanotransferase n=1 Tax=Acidihalobacter ferrooxydans TaxID=1765967 RepID=A0A1P8UH99_9GAMM|nr:4-alpha-glucanotransferase [Acidihalobacter ferrooxydans]APZ43218.1 4-alpha-glucanotransferase [Acidihalobacter ferrooxydans]